MYEEMVKTARESMGPMVKLAENNVELMVELAQSSTSYWTSTLQGNLAHLQALAATDDVKVAVDIQQKYLEELNEGLVVAAKGGATSIEAAMTKAGKIVEESMVDVKAQVQKSVDDIEKEVKKVKRVKKAA